MHRARLPIVESSTTTYGAAITGLRRDGNGEALRLEMGHIGRRCVHGKCERGIGGDVSAVFRPLDEFITWFGIRGQRAFLSIVVSTCSGHSATVVGCDLCGDDIGLRREVGNEMALPGHIEGVGRLGRNLVSVLCPIHESVS